MFATGETPLEPQTGVTISATSPGYLIEFQGAHPRDHRSVSPCDRTDQRCRSRWERVSSDINPHCPGGRANILGHEYGCGGNATHPRIGRTPVSTKDALGCPHGVGARGVSLTSDECGCSEHRLVPHWVARGIHESNEARLSVQVLERGWCGVRCRDVAQCLAREAELTIARCFGYLTITIGRGVGAARRGVGAARRGVGAARRGADAARRGEVAARRGAVPLAVEPVPLAVEPPPLAVGRRRSPWSWRRSPWSWCRSPWSRCRSPWSASPLAVGRRRSPWPLLPLAVELAARRGVGAARRGEVAARRGVGTQRQEHIAGANITRLNHRHDPL